MMVEEKLLLYNRVFLVRFGYIKFFAILASMQVVKNDPTSAIVGTIALIQCISLETISVHGVYESRSLASAYRTCVLLDICKIVTICTYANQTTL